MEVRRRIVPTGPNYAEPAAVPIPVTCQCGQSFAAGDHLAGRTVQCPKCKQPLTIPAPQASAAGSPFGAGGATSGPSIFDQAGMRTYTPGKPLCPSCSAELPPNAVLCVKCGYHLQKGRKIGDVPTSGTSGGGHDGHGGDAAESLLRRAAATIDEEKESKRLEYTQGMPWWGVAGIFLFSVGFLTMMLVLKHEPAFRYGGWTIFTLGLCGATYTGFRMLNVAFQENILQGLLYITIPMYALIYIITRWDKCGAFFLWNVIYTVTACCGLGMIMMAPWFREVEKTDRGTPRSCVIVASFDLQRSSAL
jgi:ribosomal protein L40E